LNRSENHKKKKKEEENFFLKTSRTLHTRSEEGRGKKKESPP
jgi:hypothetical protein